MNKFENKALLNINDFCEYMSIGKTKARELLREPSCCYRVKCGNRYYANKKLLDEYLEKCTKYNMVV